LGGSGLLPNEKAEVKLRVDPHDRMVGRSGCESVVNERRMFKRIRSSRNRRGQGPIHRGGGRTEGGPATLLYLGNRRRSRVTVKERRATRRDENQVTCGKREKDHGTGGWGGAVGCFSQGEK